MNAKSLILLALMATCVFGETWIPEFVRLSPEDQKKWGITVQRVEGINPSIFVSLSQETAPYCSAARVYIRNAEGRLISETNASLTENKDGTKSITIKLFDTIEGAAELIVYMQQKPDAPPIKNFGGFTFKINNKK